MGTRNLTIVVLDNKTKIAQYGQWDGYPEGQGMTALNFLSNCDISLFREQLERVRFITKYKQTEINKFFKSIGSENGWMTMEQSKKYNEKYPYLTRDHGADILNLVYNSKDKTIWLTDSSSFIADGLFCEWAYVIDLDKNTFEIYEGFQKAPLEEGQRFKDAKRKGNNDYYPAKMIKSYFLDNLPTEKVFLEEMGELVKEEEEQAT